MWPPMSGPRCPANAAPFIAKSPPHCLPDVTPWHTCEEASWSSARCSSCRMAAMVARPKRVSAPGHPVDPEGWHLRAATLADVDALYRLTCEPLVYRYLFDGAAPERNTIADGIARAIADRARTRLGLWI